jgi:hypothetical protein
MPLPMLVCKRAVFQEIQASFHNKHYKGKKDTKWEHHKGAIGIDELADK